MSLFLRTAHGKRRRSRKRSDMDYTNSQVDHLIMEWIHSERDRMILHRRFIDGIRLEALSEEFDMSVSQIKRIVNDGSRIVFSKLK